MLFEFYIIFNLDIIMVRYELNVNNDQMLEEYYNIYLLCYVYIVMYIYYNYDCL